MAKRVTGKSKKSDVVETPDGLLTRRQLAEVLGVHMMTVTKWERDGMPIAVRGAKGRPSFYDEATVQTWRRLRDNPETLDLSKERARKERAQAVLAEQQAAIRARTLIPVDEHIKAMSTEASAVRARLLAIPQTQTDRICRAFTKDGIEGVERVLEDLMVDVLRELSDPAGQAAA